MYTRRVYATATRAGVSCLIHSGAQHLALFLCSQSGIFETCGGADDHCCNNDLQEWSVIGSVKKSYLETITRVRLLVDDGLAIRQFQANQNRQMSFWGHPKTT